jgi:hypothetical protein
MFDMRIVEMFRFADGRTVLVGSVTGGPPFIVPCRCTLFVDDTQRAVIRLDGEMFPDRRHAEGYRSVSTKDEVNLEQAEVKARVCRLRQADET